MEYSISGESNKVPYEYAIIAMEEEVGGDQESGAGTDTATVSIIELISPDDIIGSSSGDPYQTGGWSRGFSCRGVGCVHEFDMDDYEFDQNG